jgi:H+/Cl- antiporter ClcA
MGISPLEAGLFCLAAAIGLIGGLLGNLFANAIGRFNQHFSKNQQSEKSIFKEFIAIMAIFFFILVVLILIGLWLISI